MEVIMDALLTKHLEASGLEKLDLGKYKNEYSNRVWEKLLQSLRQIFSLAALMIKQKSQQQNQHRESKN